MNKILQIWGWIKLNAVVLAVAAAICVAATVIAYFTGRDHGADSCEARYTKRDNVQHQEVITRLLEIEKQNALNAQRWEQENAAKDAAVETDIKTVYRELEKVVEKPVLVEGPCDFQYADAARVFDNAARAAFGD